MFVDDTSFARATVPTKAAHIAAPKVGPNFGSIVGLRFGSNFGSLSCVQFWVPSLGKGTRGPN